MPGRAVSSRRKTTRVVITRTIIDGTTDMRKSPDWIVLSMQISDGCVQPTFSTNRPLPVIQNPTNMCRWTSSRLWPNLTGHLTDGSPNVTIQHIIREDEPHPIFPNDPAAWAHVVKQARDGSHLHIQALDLACRIERLGIEASCGTW